MSRANLRGLGAGMGGGSGLGGGFWQRQRSLGYLREGKPDVRRTLLRVWSSPQPYRRRVALGTFVMLAGVGLGLIPPLLIRSLIDIAIPEHNLRLALILGSGVFLLPVGPADRTR